jgi:hypothetical protein
VTTSTRTRRTVGALWLIAASALALGACGSDAIGDVSTPTTGSVTESTVVTATRDTSAPGTSAPGTSAPLVSADDIPVGFTPPGGWTEMPPPFLAECTEPLVAGAPDMRGTWAVVAVETDGADDPTHDALGEVQRIEQCGDRVVITAGGIVHDMRADGTEENGVHDVAAADKTTPIVVVATFEDGVHVLRPVGVPLEVRRRIDGDQLVWEYVGFTARLDKV